MDGSAAASAASPEAQSANGLPPANGAPGREQAIPAAFQRQQVGPVTSAVSAGQLVDALRAAGRHAEADAVQADIDAQAAVEAAEAAMLEEIRELLKDPPRFVMQLPRFFAPVLQQIVTQAVQAALQQVPVRVSRWCSVCVAAQLTWTAAHQAQMERARELAMAELGVTDPGDPRLAQADPVRYLPAELHPGQPNGMPTIADAITTAGGQDVCAVHHPAAPQRAAGAAGLLMARGHLTPLMITEAGAIPGVFGAGAVFGRA